MSALDAPTSTSIRPGSTIRSSVAPVNEHSSACTANETRAAAPGASGTRAKPRSCRTGRVTVATGSRR